MYDFYISDVKVDDVLELTYDENLDDVASSFSFTSLKDYGLTTNDNINTLKICPKNSKTPFYFGIITTAEHTSDKNKYSYSGFDVGFYLNKNEVLKQFNNANIGDAISQLCDEYKITLKSKPSFISKVTKIYKDIVFSDILKELLELEKTKGGRKNIYIDCKFGGLELKEYSLEKNLSAQIANNILIDANKTIGGVSVKTSIEELKNRIIYTNNDEKSTKRVTAQDDSSISQFGLLTNIEQIDTSKTNNLEKLANDKLKELNKATISMSLSLLCDHRISKGKILDLNVPEYGLKGEYLITSCSHSITSCKDVASINIERYEN